MRTNLPVSNVEVILGEDTLIVSKTDLKGQITYINKDFINISGFTQAELLGQPHNLVRHPDMPVEAFADFWRDLKDGRPWTGLVKNRCKNGDFYWVLATATPILENGQVTGYMSVRRKASQAQIAEADSAYRLFREKRAGRSQIRHGQVVSGGPGPLAGLSLKSRMVAGFAALLLALVVVAGMGLWGVGRSNDAVEELYHDRLEPVQALAVIGKLMADNRSQVLLALQHDPSGAYAKAHDHTLDFHLGAIDKNIAEIGRQWEAYKKAVASTEQQALADEYLQARQLFVSDGLLAARAALADGKFGEANEILLKRINPLYVEAAKKADQLLQQQNELSRAQLLASNEGLAQLRLWVLLLVAAACAAGVVIAGLIIRSVTRPIAATIETMQSLANGDFTRNVDISRNDEMGKVLQGLQSMQIQQGFNVAESIRLANDNLRIRIALDCVSANLRIADDDGTVIYANRGLLNTLRSIEDGLRQKQPDFSVDRFIGSNIGSFYDNPAAALQSLRELQQTRSTEMDIGGRIYNVLTNPIVNERGQRLGTVGEWVDRTAELNAQRSVAALISKASAGDLEARLDTDTLEGFYKELGSGINSLLETSGSAIGEIAGLLERVAGGDLTCTVDTEYQGTFAKLRDDANETVTRLRELVGDIQGSADAINTAAKEIASGNQDLSSRTEEQASSLEETASSMEQLTATVRQNAENARQANGLAGSAQSVAEKGGEVVGQVVETMASIHQASTRIADIIGVIDGIAFQTNILALNAAVEAARAGEQGRGFAVVATEVRNLAQRSATAAKEIKGLISDSVDRVERGNRLVDQAGRTMAEVVASIKRVTGIMADIAAASREQSSGIEQVSLAVGQMDQVTQQNAALVEEAAAAAESLEEQARQLAESVAVFRVGQEAANTPLLRSTPPEVQKTEVRKQAPAAKRLSMRKAALPVSLDDEWEEF
ncbi:methyl-accepting chemotaxis protein [Dechloromonas hortensis]|uniref:methyl-accepting chemotaxis protein n=1 Tax=Dechloromonas hortensis TaxID=337779 RepID=UPI002483700C|nr:methyl-accepting chemotaxis protein [Dechloromonas hortensis]